MVLWLFGWIKCLYCTRISISFTLFQNMFTIYEIILSLNMSQFYINIQLYKFFQPGFNWTNLWHFKTLYQFVVVIVDKTEETLSSSGVRNIKCNIWRYVITKKTPVSCTGIYTCKMFEDRCKKLVML